MVLIAAGTAVSAIGCGTCLNLKCGHPEPFGGVQRDVAFLTEPGHVNSHNGDNGFGAAIFMGIWAADLCASGVGDTLTLPFIAHQWEKKDREDRENAERGNYHDLPVQYSAGAVVDRPSPRRSEPMDNLDGERDTERTFTPDTPPARLLPPTPRP
jgi:hypothetical protein